MTIRLEEINRNKFRSKCPHGIFRMMEKVAFLSADGTLHNGHFETAEGIRFQQAALQPEAGMHLEQFLEQNAIRLHTGERVDIDTLPAWAQYHAIALADRWESAVPPEFDAFLEHSHLHILYCETGRELYDGKTSCGVYITRGYRTPIIVMDGGGTDRDGFISAWGSLDTFFHELGHHINKIFRFAESRLFRHLADQAHACGVALGSSPKKPYSEEFSDTIAYTFENRALEADRQEKAVDAFSREELSALYKLIDYAETVVFPILRAVANLQDILPGMENEQFGLRDAGTLRAHCSGLLHSLEAAYLIRNPILAPWAAKVMVQAALSPLQDHGRREA